MVSVGLSGVRGGAHWVMLWVNLHAVVVGGSTLRPGNGPDAIKRAIIDVNSIVSGQNYDILASIIAQLLTLRPFPELIQQDQHTPKSTPTVRVGNGPWLLSGGGGNQQLVESLTHRVIQPRPVLGRAKANLKHPCFI